MKSITDSRQSSLATVKRIGTGLAFIKITAEYPPACWWDESSSPLGEVKALAKRQS
jgi:hypothetical protein